MSSSAVQTHCEQSSIHHHSAQLHSICIQPCAFLCCNSADISLQNSQQLHSCCHPVNYMPHQQPAPPTAAGAGTRCCCSNANQPSLSSKMQITSAACSSTVLPLPLAAAGASRRGCCRAMAAGVVPLSRSLLAAGRLLTVLKPASPPLMLPASSELQRL
jgi:hypothetical protein